MKTVRNLTAMAVVAAALTFAAQARASTIDFWLTQPEGGGTPISDSVAVEVAVNWISSTSATVTFTNPDPSINMAPVELNISGEFEASSTEGLAPASPCGGNGYAGVGACSTGGDGAGTFGDMSLETGAASHSTITLTLTAEGTNTWANAAAVLTPDSKGFEALVNDASNNEQDAGFYAATPLPAALPLFATGLGVMGLLGRRRKRKAQALAA